MANSRLGMETKAITEGAVMATLTAILAMAGIYIPILEPFIMLVWTLPVVVTCMRRGMRAGAAAMAVAGLIILITTTPYYAVDMIIRFTGPALLIGYGFRCQWRPEKIILYTAISAFVGLAATYALSFFIMGMSFNELFMIQPETVEEITALFSDYGLAETLQMSVEEMTDYITALFSMIKYLFPSILLISGLFTAITNYAAANFILGKLKIPLPPVIRMSSFRLPFELVFGFITGFGMSVIGGTFFPQVPVITEIGQNLMAVFLVLYFFQGLGLLYYYIEKAPQNMWRFWKIALIIAFILTAFRITSIVCFAGLIDALLDFRRLEQFLMKKKQGGRGI